MAIEKLHNLYYTELQIDEIILMITDILFIIGLMISTRKIKASKSIIIALLIFMYI